jgi:sugar lactone lactonase YvrE
MTAATAEPTKVAPVMVVKADAGIKTPESVLYDPEGDQYLVSNINGKPDEADDNGFISKVSPDGKVTELKWIDGAKPEIKLNAPKGLALSPDTLYVSDIDRVRMFDRKTGKPKGEVVVKGATFLNDVAIDSKGTVYVSDSGVKVGKEGFEPTGTDAVYEIGKGRVAKAVFKSKDLARPNGLALVGGHLWVNTLGSNEVYQLAADGMHDPIKMPKGTLDGLVALDDGSMLVSSWEASQVWRGKPGGTFDVVVPEAKSPADIGYDSKRHRILIPIFTGDSIEAYDLPGTASMAPADPLAPPPKATPAPKTAADAAKGGTKSADAAKNAAKADANKTSSGAAAPIAPPATATATTTAPTTTATPPKK